MEDTTGRGKKEGQAKTKPQQPKFKFSKYDMEDLYLNSKIPKSLAEDLTAWAKDKQFRWALTQELNSWMFEKGHQKRLEESAKVAVRVIDKLLLKELPIVVMDVYLSLLNSRVNQVGKWLDHQAADKLFKFIPTAVILKFISLFKLPLSEKQKDSLLKELVRNEATCNSTLASLPVAFKDKQRYTNMLIEQLAANKKQNVAAQVMKKLKVPKESFPRIQAHLIEVSAITMHRWTENFTWERLEEVFQQFPSAIAASIRSTYNNKKVKKDMLEGFASICRRIPEVLGLIPVKIRERFQDLMNQVPNLLRTNKFEPSNPKEQVCLSDFGYSEKSMVWVDESNLRDCLVRITDSRVIGIDTESRVVRTTLDTSYDVLATIQIAADKSVYILDALVLKKIQLELPQVSAFFTNKEVTVVGHTLEADLNQEVARLLGFNGNISCNAVDICPIFKELYPGVRPGLASITKTLLGKDLCKEYTLTNWERRPLLKNQIHYAALDAVIVIKLWEKLKEHPNYDEAEKKIKKSREDRANGKKVKKEEEEKGEGGQEEEKEGSEEGDEKQELEDTEEYIADK